METSGFWQNLPHPIIGLAPMDGVSDAACRYITACYGKPAILFTEFTAAEGLRAGAERLMEDFYYHPLERPIIAQVFGSEPDAFFDAAIVASAMGFDGIDINMGCPAKNVAERGAGAALIRDPARAQEIIRQTKAGTLAWANGITLEDAGVHPRLIPHIMARRKVIEQLAGQPLQRVALPVSVKTRIGYDSIVIERWIGELLTEKPVAITIHGRTLKQLYTGEANWEAIAAGVATGKGSGTLFLGNGDITSVTDGKQRAAEAGADGFLIGRYAIGNPWIFLEKNPTPEERKQVILEHAHYLHTIFEGRGFMRIRKHLFEYTRGCVDAKEVRINLSKMNTLEDVESLLEKVDFRSQTVN